MAKTYQYKILNCRGELIETVDYQIDNGTDPNQIHDMALLRGGYDPNAQCGQCGDWAYRVELVCSPCGVCNGLGYFPEKDNKDCVFCRATGEIPKVT